MNKEVRPEYSSADISKIKKFSKSHSKVNWAMMLGQFHIFCLGRFRFAFNVDSAELQPIHVFLVVSSEAYNV